jgi:hypothetical protein
VGEDLSQYTPWRIAGRYFESCNCDAICPCRMVDGVEGGRSTHGICFGVLSWLIDEGRAGDVELAGLAAALVCRYDDDEPGSPWTILVHVDGRGDERQREALASILLGRLGGDDVLGLPWVRKPNELVGVEISPIELTSGPEGHELRVGTKIEARAVRPVGTGEDVRCIIPGYRQPGTEYVAEELTVDDAPFQWELAGNCAFASSFAYAS